MYVMSNAVQRKSPQENLNMIHCFVNGDYSAIEMAYNKILLLENEHNLPHIISCLKTK